LKTSWIIFVVFAYLAIFYFGGIAEYNSLLNSQVVANVQSLAQPSGTNFFVAGVMQVALLWDYIRNFIQMIFLWNGTLWVGSWLYFYYFVCLPICIGVVMSIVFVLRGVHNS
jgi:hypothetical protein